MNNITERLVQHVSSQDLSTLLWEAAVVAALLAAIVLYAARARQTREIARRHKLMRSRMDLRSRGA